MSSSKNAFPFRLDQLGFNPCNFTKLIFAGEVPPADMFALLTTHWGIGEHLATAFMNFYGGHVFDAYNAIFELSELKEKYIQESPWSTSLKLNALPSCWDMASGSESDRNRMKQVLNSLAISGFSKIDSTSNDDKVVEMISSHSIGGVVSQGATVVGLPATVFNNTCKRALVPAKQSVRLMIAMDLVA